MNKRTLFFFITIGLLMGSIITGCAQSGSDENEEINEETPEQTQEEKPRETEKRVIDGTEGNAFYDVPDEELIDIGRELIQKFDSLSLAETEEEFDKIRKELFVSYDFYAPLDDYEEPNKEVKTTPSNEEIIKSDAY